MSESEDNLFNNDPLYMVSLVGKKVEIVAENKSFLGIVYVVDPIYKTTILHTNWRSENEYKTTVIFHKAIKSLKVVSEEVIESYKKRLEKPPLDNDHKEMRKKLVHKWLKHMFLNVIVNGDYLKIEDHLVIVPPYGPDNCICNNTIILDKIQKILEVMPSDFE